MMLVMVMLPSVVMSLTVGFFQMAAIFLLFAAFGAIVNIGEQSWI
jgi:hypothetical protein